LSDLLIMNPFLLALLQDKGYDTYDNDHKHNNSGSITPVRPFKGIFIKQVGDRFYSRPRSAALIHNHVWKIKKLECTDDPCLDHKEQHWTQKRNCNMEKRMNSRRSVNSRRL